MHSILNSARAILPVALAAMARAPGRAAGQQQLFELLPADSAPHDHFGSAPFFTFIDTETMAVEAVRNGGASHVHGACRPLDFLGARPVEAVVCRGLGRRAFSRQAGS